MKIYFEKREDLCLAVRALIPVVCVAAALLFCGVLMLALGYDAIAAYGKLFRGGFGSSRALSESILQATPLMFCGLGVSISFTMGLNNIGAEGQFMMGAFAATGVALYCPWIPPSMALPAAFMAGFLAGGLWAVIATAPRALWGVNETIITLMFNYIALLWVDHFVYGPWRDTAAKAANLPYSAPLPPWALAPTLGGTRITCAIFLAGAAAVLIGLFLGKTVHGYQIRVIGANPRAAAYAGMDIVRHMVLVMLLSGGLAGLAGVAQVTGPVGRLQPGLANGVGYIAIIVAYLAKCNPLTVIAVSLLFGGLAQGGYSVQLVGVSKHIVVVIQGLILFFVLGGDIFMRNRLVIRFNRGEGFRKGEAD